MKKSDPELHREQQLAEGKMKAEGPMTYILNFGYKLHHKTLQYFQPAKEIYIKFPHMDLQQSTLPQIKEVVDLAVKLLKLEGITLDNPYLYAVLPGVTEGAVILVCEIYKRIGRFPIIVALRKKDEGYYGLLGNNISDGTIDLDIYR